MLLPTLCTVSVTGRFLHCALASSAVYCNRSCLYACLWRAGGVCYHDNSKLHASIFTKLDQVQVVTMSSWLNFGGPAPPGRGLRRGEIWDPLITFERKEQSPSNLVQTYRTEHLCVGTTKTTHKWAWQGSRDLIS